MSKLTFVEAGSGLPVVLIHGFPLSHEIWRFQRESLAAQGFRVITPNLRGHGDSPATDGPYEMAALIQDVFDLLDHLKIQKAVIVGHSMGGYATLAGWKLAPERFLGLGLAASQANADSDEARKGRLQTIEKVKAEGPAVVANAMIPKLFASSDSAPAEAIDSVRNIMLHTPVPALTGALQGMAARPDFNAAIPTISVPFLVLAGEKDHIIPLERSAKMATDAKAGELVVISGAGHMPMIEKPEETTKALAAFLRRSFPA